MSQSSQPKPSQVAPDNIDELITRNVPIAKLPGYWDTVASNTTDWAREVTACPFWSRASMALGDWEKQYRREFNSELTKGSWPHFIGKSAERIREKTRAKIKQAENRQEELLRLYDSATPVPRLEDLVRVRVNCPLLDGVPFLAQRLVSLATELGCETTLEAKGNLRGYFAQHLLFKTPVYFRINGAAQSYLLTCEVQIATALATSVWENSHSLYEISRVSEDLPEEWQWSPSDPRFLSRQLGHMIHLADGLFCLLRDAGNKERKR